MHRNSLQTPNRRDVYINNTCSLSSEQCYSEFRVSFTLRKQRISWPPCVISSIPKEGLAPGSNPLSAHDTLFIPLSFAAAEATREHLV